MRCTRTYAHTQTHTDTHSLHVFPNDNDTNKMAYIFYTQKTKIAEAKSGCDVLRWNCTNTRAAPIYSKVKSVFCLNENVGKQFNLCAGRKMQEGHFLFFLQACVRRQSVSLCGAGCLNILLTFTYST